MRILAIETSCDETAVTVLEADGDTTRAHFRVLGNALLSQIDIHQEFGGVYPAVAKREHAKNLVPVLAASLAEAALLAESPRTLSPDEIVWLRELLSREPELADALIAFLGNHGVPAVDAIAVTSGPGLAPALWVGVNFARALARIGNLPLVAANHMEGHLLSALATPGEDERSFSLENITLPALGLLISGGHTELVLMDPWLSYRLVGRTRDDAVGEAYDKVARMLGLPYPGGPEVSRLAEAARTRGNETLPALPRPMLHDGSCDFSFSGLKTAVLYLVRDRARTETEKEEVAHAFEEAAADVLYAKTARALEETGAATLALGGGVSANTHIRRTFKERIAREHPHVTLYLPEFRFTTDNAVMIGIAGFYHALRKEYADPGALAADGNLALAA